MVKVAVLGCGRIAQHHCSSIMATSGLELVAVCDFKSELSEKTGDEYNVAWFTEFSKLAESVEFDVVAVITPSGMHFPHALTILERYQKHLILEKPPVLRKQDFIKITSAASSLGKKIFPIFQNRKNRAVTRVKRAVLNGELGVLQSVSVRVRWCRDDRYYNLAPWRGTFAMDGGCLTNQGVHHLDLVRYLVGEPASVLGLSATFGSTIEVEDSYIGMCKFLQSKCLGTIEVTTAARPRDFCAEISILGSSGMAQIGGIAVNELQIFTPDETECSRYSEDFSDCVYGNGHKDLYREISDDLHSRSSTNSYSIDIEDALGTLAFLDACYRSSENYAWAEVRAVEESVNLGRPDSALTDFYKLT